MVAIWSYMTVCVDGYMTVCGWSSAAR